VGARVRQSHQKEAARVRGGRSHSCQDPSGVASCNTGFVILKEFIYDEFPASRI